METALIETALQETALVEEYLEVEGATELFPVVFPALELDGSALEVDLSLSTMNPVDVFDEFLK